MILSMLLDVRGQRCRLSLLKVKDVDPESVEQYMAGTVGALASQVLRKLV